MRRGPAGAPAASRVWFERAMDEVVWDDVRALVGWAAMLAPGS